MGRAWIPSERVVPMAGDEVDGSIAPALEDPHGQACRAPDSWAAQGAKTHETWLRRNCKHWRLRSDPEEDRLWTRRCVVNDAGALDHASRCLAGGDVRATCVGSQPRTALLRLRQRTGLEESFAN